MRTKIIERELVLLQLLELRLSFILIDLILNLFDQRKHIAHAENALGHAIGIERFERVVLFAHADKLYRLADDLLNREGRAAARIAVHLGQDHAGYPDAPVELFRRSDGILSGHCVGDKKDFDRMGFALDADQLFHQLIVDVQASGGINQQRVVTNIACVLQSCPRQFQRVVRLRLFKDRLAGRLGDDL